MREVFDYGLTICYNMMKRKTQTSELRTTPITLSVHKYDSPVLKGSIKQYWGIQNSQPFFPPIEKLFKTDSLECASDYGIKFDDQMTCCLSDDTIRTTSGSKTFHKKVSMLLSPYKWMQGDYGMALGLPSTTDQAGMIYSKLQNHNNSSYVGSLISAVLSQSGCDHFPKVYGVFSGTSAYHKIDISDDYGDLCDRTWFSQNIGKTFDITLSEDVKDTGIFKHTRSARVEIQLGEDIDLGNIPELDAPSVQAEMADMNKMFTEDEKVDNDDETSSNVSTSYIFDIKSCDCDEDESVIDDEEIEPYAWATFENVPVQVTVMEKCEGTLYELMMMNFDSQKHLAWLSQVIFALAYAQRNFAFTHNDLHANNVMYVKTDKEFLYYNSGGVLYRVPTYGYLIKIIDFERGIAQIKLTGMKDPKLFISDHFSVNEEAGGQYNYGDFYIQKFPEIKPNPSFDLVRLATSLFWDLFPEGPGYEQYKDNQVFKFFIKWLSLEDGKSVLFSEKDAKHDRYHGFHMYKAIARYCKDNAVPRKEISSLKSFFEVSSVTDGSKVLLIDS